MNAWCRIAQTKPAYYRSREWIHVELNSPQGRCLCLRRIIAHIIITLDRPEDQILQTMGGRNESKSVINGFELLQYNR